MQVLNSVPKSFINELDRSSDMQGYVFRMGKQNIHINFGRETYWKTSTLNGEDRRILQSERDRERERDCEGWTWVQLVQDRLERRALLSAVFSLRDLLTSIRLFFMQCASCHLG
jgi:hypothetical protein